ncbi:MAG: hypothetical protein HC888_01690 [Candidatus Competibacteraceae bacterium]|nr:hypothetical protein [Candidatus Competibacteraceae bacterium]
MKFYNSNKISTGKGKSFDELVAAYRQQKMDSAQNVVKTASTQSPKVKVAEVDEPERPAAKGKDAEEGKSSGQLDVEPLHQDGESTPKVKSGKEAEAVTQNKEAGLENIPEEKRAKPFGSKDEDKDGDKEDKKDDKKPTDKEASSSVDKDNENKDDAEDSKQPKWEGEKKNNNDPDAGKHRDGDQKKASSTGYIKLANLDAKNEKKLRNYWSNIWPKEFVDAMLSKK